MTGFFLHMTAECGGAVHSLAWFEHPGLYPFTATALPYGYKPPSKSSFKTKRKMNSICRAIEEAPLETICSHFENIRVSASKVANNTFVRFQMPRHKQV